MANENMIRFLRGKVASLPATATAGAVYFTKDEGLYLGLEDGTYHRYGDFIMVADVASLPEAGAHENCMYYCIAENILAKWSESEGKWIQINKQKTLAELGGVAKSVYEAKVALLEQADTTNATNIANLTTYVGTIPEGATATNVVAYIQERTSGIATDTALAELAGKVTANENAIKALQEANAEGGAVATAIATAQAAAEAAQADVDALELKVGTVEEGKTVVDMINAVDEIADKGVADAAAAQAKADSAYELAEGKATMTEVNEAIANAGHAVKADVDAALEQLGKDYVAADASLKSELEGKINAKVAQADYDAKVAELEGADTTLQNNIDAEATARSEADTALGNRIGTLEGQITGLSGAMHFKGVENAIPEDVTGYADGDVIIVGDKEYVFNEGTFVEFGDVSAEGERIAALEGIVGKEAEGENAATGLVKAVADNAAAIATEKGRAEAKEAELAQADADNLQAAKDYADAAVEALNIGDYAKQADLDGVDGRVTTAEGKIADLETASATHALKTEVEAVQTNLDEYIESNDAAVALKADTSVVSAMDTAYKAADTALSNRIKDLEDNKAGYATTSEVATAKSEAISAAEAKATELDNALKAELQKEIDDDVKALADGAVATNAAGIASLVEQLTWGEF